MIMISLCAHELRPYWGVLERLLGIIRLIKPHESARCIIGAQGGPRLQVGQ